MISDGGGGGGGGEQETVFSPDLTYKISMKVKNKQHGIDSQTWKVGGGAQLVGRLMTPHSTLKWEVCTYVCFWMKCTGNERRSRTEAYDRSQSGTIQVCVGGGGGWTGGLWEEEEEVWVEEEDGAVPPKETHCPSDLRDAG